MKNAILRRFLVLVAAIFWQGGFVFYGAVVVPVARSTFDPPDRFALVTQKVTIAQNFAGVLALVVLLWDLRASTDASVARRKWRWRLWVFLLASLAAMFVLHVVMSRHIDPGKMPIPQADKDVIRPWHIAYLWIGTMQWAACVAVAVLMLCAWRAEDGKC